MTDGAEIRGTRRRGLRRGGQKHSTIKRDSLGEIDYFRWKIPFTLKARDPLPTLSPTPEERQEAFVIT